MQAVGALGFVVVVAAALAVGPGVLALVAIVAAFVALLDATLLFTRAGVRTVLPAAVAPALGIPVLAALAEGDTAWHSAGELFAATVIGGFALVILFGRRTGVVAGLGVALACGLLVGLGAGSVVLIGGLTDGVRWLVALLALVAVADLAMPLATIALEGRARRRGSSPGGVGPLLVTAAAVALVALGLAQVLDPPMTLAVAAVLAAAAVVAGVGGDHLRRVLATEAGFEDGASGLGTGAVLGAVDGLLLSAPVAYVLASSVVTY